jgi:catechol 2,3-dioxygenase-like lactoylglutathione lyase family enzyme
MAPSQASAPAFTSVHPVFAVRDLAEALAYYRDVLGFRVAWTWGDPPVRAGVARGAVEIQLVSDGRFAPPGPSCVYCHLAGVDAFYAECRARGAEIIMELDDRPFGVRDFRVADPSGNRLGFGEPAAG